MKAIYNVYTHAVVGQRDNGEWVIVSLHKSRVAAQRRIGRGSSRLVVNLSTFLTGAPQEAR